MPTAWVAFQLTDRCALDCRHCFRDPPAAPTDLPPALVARLLDEARRLHRIDHVALTGGEPVLHPRLGEVLDAIVARGLSWHLVTSGRGFERLVKLLEESPPRRAALTAVDLSLEGAEAATHDAIRGPGSHRKVLAAALACRAREIPFSLQMAVNARNVAELERLGLLAAELGAGRVLFAATQPTGTPEDDALYLPVEAWRQIRDRIDRLGEALRIPVAAAEGFPRAQPFHVCEPWRTEALHVDVRGRLTVCCQLAGGPGGDADVVADLAEVSLAEAHAALLDRVHALQRERLALVTGGNAVGWDAVPCAWCARRHGRPHWRDGGRGGPAAVRARRGSA
jgi:MoaA/NifB/PqqE/SkfB family radical SAM enzyme